MPKILLLAVLAMAFLAAAAAPLWALDPAAGLSDAAPESATESATLDNDSMADDRELERIAREPGPLGKPDEPDGPGGGSLSRIEDSHDTPDKPAAQAAASSNDGREALANPDMGAQKSESERRTDVAVAANLASLKDLAGEAARIAKEVEDQAESFNQKRTEISNRFSQLDRLYGYTLRQHPGEQEDALSQMRSLGEELAALMAPFEEKLAEVDLMIANNRSRAPSGGAPQSGGGEPAAEASGEDVKSSAEIMAMLDKIPEADGGDDTTSLQSAEESVGSIMGETRKLIEATLNPAVGLLAAIGSRISAIEGELPETWRGYYLRNAGTGGLINSWRNLGPWRASFSKRSVFFYPQTAADWLNTLIRFLVTAALIILAATILKAWGDRIPAKLLSGDEAREGAAEVHQFLMRMLRGPGVHMTFGAALLSAASHGGGSYFAIMLPGILLLIHGLSIFSWQLRIASWRIRGSSPAGGPEVRPPAVKEGTPSPLSRLNKPAGIGIALLFLDLPIGAMTIIWLATLLIFLNWLRRSAAHDHDYSRLPMAERLSYGNTVVFVVMSLLIALVGFSRLAILVLMVLYTLVNVIILGSALVAVTAKGCQLLYSDKIHPVRHSLLRALALPLSFMVSLVSALPWLWSVPGSLRLLEGVMGWDLHLGKISFNFSRIILIIMFYILFKSLKGLGVTSLSHLPDTLPNVERRVIQPLQTLFTYFLWGMFAMLSLTMVGVSLSALAMVIGGMSVGVSMGLQHHISNFVSGLLIIFGRSILVGDWVEVGDVVGRVDSVDIRCTILETSEKGHVYVPNSSFMVGKFINWTRRSERQCRKMLSFSTIYGTDVPLVKEILLRIADEERDIFHAGSGLDPAKFPPPAVTVDALSEEAVIVTLAVTIMDVDLETATKSRLREKAYRLFNEHGVRFYIRNELMLSGQTGAMTD